MPIDFAEKHTAEVRDLDDTSAALAFEPIGEPSYDDIAIEAYTRWIARGGGDGSDVADWLEAEQTLRTQRHLVPA